MADRVAKRILVVDDNALFARSFIDIVEDEGFRVVIADGGRAGIEAFKAALDGGEPFAIVFTDLGMPEVDGQKVIQAVKTISPGTPVILMTGSDSELGTERGAPLTADGVLGKPPKLRALRAALAKCG